MAELVVEDWELDPDVHAVVVERVSAAEPGAAFLLPARMDGTTGLYHESQIAIPKQLRANDVHVEFIHARDDRRALGEFSAEELILGFAIGVAQNMTWDAAKAIWQFLAMKATALSTGEQPATIDIEIARVILDDRTVEGIRIKGPANDETAVAVLNALTGSLPGGADK